MMKTVISESGSYEFHHQMADGSIRDVEVFSNKIQSAGKDFLYFIIHDITTRKQVEKKLQALNDELGKRVEQRTCELQEAQTHYLHAENSRP